MTDTVIKGTGNSRYLKSNIPEDTTLEELIALLRAGTFPCDLFGVNTSGFSKLGTPLSKVTLLQDFTAQLIGLNPDDDPTVDDALLSTYLAASDASLVKIKVYETGTTKPIGGVMITGVTSMTGGTLHADSNGDAVGLSSSASATISIDTRYIDLTSIKSVTVSTPKKSVTSVTLYATRVTNTSGKTETFTTSTQKMFTNKVKRVDVHCVGGGAGGSTGAIGGGGTSQSVNGGNGGAGGSSVYRLSVSFSPNSAFGITVGSKGTGATYSGGGTSFSKSYGTNGGASSALGVTASGGSRTGGGAGAYIRDNGYVDSGNAQSGNASTVHRFGESALPIVGGGAGGGGAAYMSTGGRYARSATGADPNGGDGGETSGAYPQASNPGKAATGYGGGGGGASVNSSSLSSANGGDGYQGIVYLRWFY